MPKPFTARLGTSGEYNVRAGAESFGAITGREMRQLGKESQNVLGVLKEKQDNEEVRRMHLKAAELRTRHAQAMEEARLSGRDFEEVREEFAAEIEGLNDFATSRKSTDMLNLTKEQLRLGFFNAEARAMAGRAGEQATLHYQNFLQFAAQGLAADPSTAEQYKDNLQAYVETLDDISPEARAELFNNGASEIDRAAVATFTNLNPEFVLDALKSTDNWKHLTAVQRAAAVGNAQAEIDRNRAKALELRKLAIWEKGQRADSAMAQFTVDVMSGDIDTIQGAVDGLSHNPDLSDEDMRVGLNFFKSMNNEKTKPRSSDLRAMDNLFTRIMLPPGDPNRITSNRDIVNAFADQKLSTSDFNFLMKLFEDDKSPAGRTFKDEAKPILEELKARISHDTIMSPDPEGRATFHRLTRKFFERSAELRENNQDPRVLLDPSNPNFVGFWREAQPRPMPSTIQSKVKGMRVESEEVLEVRGTAELNELPDGTRYRIPNHPQIDPERVFVKGAENF